MLVLFETAAGYAIFRVVDEKKLQQVNISDAFSSPEGALQIVKLQQFLKFKDASEAVAAATALIEGKVGKKLKKLLKKLVEKEPQEQLAVLDAKLGNAIREKMGVSCVTNTQIAELFRGIREQASALLSTVGDRDMHAMALGLAHGLARYKLKFSPDKVDTMIVQAVSLLDDLDKELNNYAMRMREWYGWHFPELGKLIADHVMYAKLVRLVGDRTNFQKAELKDLLNEEEERAVKEASEVSMGTEVSEEDIENVRFLCEQLIEMSEYRTKLAFYLENRMRALAPNLTVLVGELVGARLIARAGSLMNLAKYPSSTVQILGAEKALFRALKSKKNTPKYGLLYHAALVGQSNAKLKGKVSRMLAAKASLAVRFDALGDDVNAEAEFGQLNLASLRQRLSVLETQSRSSLAAGARGKRRFDTFENRSEVRTYDAGLDTRSPGANLSGMGSLFKTPKAAGAEADAQSTNRGAEGVGETGEKKTKKRKLDESIVEQVETPTETGEAKKKKKKKQEAE